MAETMNDPKRVAIDIRGQICPSTLLTALKEINTHKEGLRSGGTRLVIMTTNRNATSTIPNTASDMGYTAEVVKEDGYYIIEISGTSS